MCKTPLEPGGAVTVVEPIKAFPLIRDLVTDVSDNWKVASSIPPFTPKESTDHVWKFYQIDVERSRELRKCIECFLCQDVCHVIREHKADYIGPRFVVKAASFDLHPMDGLNRSKYLKDEAGLGYCNITKCCQEICPEHIIITDDAIIPEKERVVDRHYDPIVWLYRVMTSPEARATSTIRFFSIIRRIPGMRNINNFEQLVKRLLKLIFWALILIPLILAPIFFFFSGLIRI
jgi:succinate dehydrogenase / fumarate reductase iron-sulfur subunit